MRDCPFEALNWAIGYEARIAVTDGKKAAVATVERRYDEPIEEGLPAWALEWELYDELAPHTPPPEDENLLKAPLLFTPTLWTFLPEIPFKHDGASV